MSQHLTVAADPGRQARDNSLNQGASCGSGSGGGAATAGRAKHRTAAQPIQLYSASWPWTNRRRVWRGLIVLMAPYRAALFYRIPPMGGTKTLPSNSSTVTLNSTACLASSQRASSGNEKMAIIQTMLS